MLSVENAKLITVLESSNSQYSSFKLKEYFQSAVLDMCNRLIYTHYDATEFSYNYSVMLCD